MKAGVVLKAQGIRGEIKVRPLTDAPEDFGSVDRFAVGGREYAVERIRVDGDFVYLKLKGIDDRNAAEAMAGQEICFPYGVRPALPEGRYYIEDIVGCDAYAGDRYLGVVSDVLQYGAADIWCIDGETSLMVPLAEGVLLGVDLEGHVVRFEPIRLEEVAVRED